MNSQFLLNFVITNFYCISKDNSSISTRSQKFVTVESRSNAKQNKPKAKGLNQKGSNVKAALSIATYI